MQTDSFVLRHLGPNNEEVSQMLETIGVSSIEELIFNTIPDDILLKRKLNLPEAMIRYHLGEKQLPSYRNGEFGIYTATITAQKPCCKSEHGEGHGHHHHQHHGEHTGVCACGGHH